LVGFFGGDRKPTQPLQKKRKNFGKNEPAKSLLPKSKP
jgi:hypothetical protein